MAATPSTLEFGVVSLGNSANQKVSVTNKGSDPIQISQLSLSNAAFRVDGQGTLPASLAVGGSLSFNVQFVPTDSTELTSHLSVITNGSSTPAATVKLHGKGSAQNALLSDLNCDTITVTGAVSDACTLLRMPLLPLGDSW